MNARAILSFPDLAPLSTVQHISVSVSLEDTDGFECLFTFYYLTMEPALLPVPSCIQRQFIRGKRKKKKLIFLEKCIQHLIEAWRRETEQRILTNLFSNFFFFPMENLDTKSIFALQTAIYLVTCFSDTRHYEHARIAVGWNRIRWCGCLSFRIDVHLLRIKRIYLVTKYQGGKLCSDGRVANSASGGYQAYFNPANCYSRWVNFYLTSHILGYFSWPRH